MEYNNMREMLEDRVAKTPDWFYLAYYGRYLTFKQFNDEVNRLANAFLKLGIKKRDIVYIHLTNCPEHLICTMAVLKIRAIACPLNPQFTPDELLYHVNDSRGVMTITESMNIGVVDAVRDQFKYIKNVIEIGDKVSERNLNYKNLIAQESTELKPIDIKSDDYAFIFYTSGTTGKPKGALLNHSNLVSTSIGMIKAIEESTGQVYDDNVNQRRAMYFLPLFHVNAMMSVLTCIYTGAKVALLKKFSVREFGPTVEQEKPETFSAVPKVYKILLEAKDTVKKYDLSSLERTVCGSAPMPVETINQFEKEFSIELYEAYGLTEATVASTMNLKGKRLDQ